MSRSVLVELFDQFLAVVVIQSFQLIVSILIFKASLEPNLWFSVLVCGSVRSTFRLSGRNELRACGQRPGHTSRSGTLLEEYGAVERSPVYVQFSNAGVLLTNLAIEECLGVASVSVAPIVPRTMPRLVRTIMTSR